MHAEHDFIRRQRGMSVVETVVGLTLVSGIIGVFAVLVSDTALDATQSAGAADLHDSGRRALDRIARDLVRTGRRADAVGVTLPHVFTDGKPGPALSALFEHDVQELQAHAATFPPAAQPPAGGANPAPYVAPELELSPTGIREIVFRRPGDEDGDGTEFSQLDGSLEWGKELYGFLMQPDGQGSFQLVRRRADDAGNVTDELICRNVDAITFDTNLTRPRLPLDAVEIHLHLLRQDGRGHDQRIHLSTTVMMRNTP